MKKEEIKAEAEKIVLSFIYVPDSAMPPNSNKAWIDQILAIRCAIIHVKRIIKVAVSRDTLPPNYPGPGPREYWQSILTELEKK